ncbi:hypothetical protein ACF0H5_017644 [Mactra antiquata]
MWKSTMASFSVEDETIPGTSGQNIPTFIKPSNKKISRDVSKYLDEVGFSGTQIWNRIHYMNIDSKVRDISIKFSINTNNERILIGSQREGLGLKGLSDIDILQVEHDVICTKETSFVDDARLVLKIVDSNTPPGYCQLQVDKSAIDSRIFEKYQYATVHRDGNTFLSSMKFVTELKDDVLNASEFRRKYTWFLSQHGPSRPRNAHGMTLSLSRFPLDFGIDWKSDFVCAFPCDENAALNVWQNRPRKYDWPSGRLIRQIMTLPIYVVPVGHKGSINENLEWRISFVLAEIKLVQSFNNIQMKIFLLLKIFAKRYLEPKPEIISSYVIKNIMFWLAEDIPQKKFLQKHLMARMVEALENLREAVRFKKLRNYMQPENNLFANKLDDAKQQLLMNKLNYIMCNGKAEICHFLSDVGHGYKDNIHQNGNALQSCNLATQREMYDFLQLNGTKIYLYIQLLTLNCKSAKEVLILSICFHILRNANTFDTNIKNDTYCSRKLIKADKELTATTITDILPNKLERWGIKTAIFIIRFVSKLIYIPTKKVPDPTDGLKKPECNTRPPNKQSKPLAPLRIRMLFLLMILCPTVSIVCYSIHILLLILVYYFKAVIYILPSSVLILFIRWVPVHLWSSKIRINCLLGLTSIFECLTLMSSTLWLFILFLFYNFQIWDIFVLYLELPTSVFGLIYAIFFMNIRFRTVCEKMVEFNKKSEVRIQAMQ